MVEANVKKITDNKPIYAGIFLVVCGLGGVYFRAFLLGALVRDVALPSFLASNIIAASAAGILLGNVFMLLKVHKWNRKKIALAAIFCMLISNVSGIFFHQYEDLIVILFLSGLGEGTLVALGSAVIAGSSNVARFVGLQTVMGSTVAAGTAFGAPYFIEWEGINGIFMFLLLFPCIAFFSTRWLMAFPSTRIDQESHSASSVNMTKTAFSILATLVMFTGIGMFWPFLETIVMASGVSSSVFGIAVSIGMFLGGVVALAATVLGDRYGYFLPSVVGASVMALAAMISMLTLTEAMVLLLVPVYLMASMLLVVYHNAFLASLDTRGRVYVFGVTMESLGAILGPLVAGVVIRMGGGYQAVTWLFVGAAVVYCLMRGMCFINVESHKKSLSF